jgi:hypothetical protein
MRADQRLHAADILTASARGYPAGFIIHSAIHMAQTELVCVMHSHTAARNAVKRPLSCSISFAITTMKAQPWMKMLGPGGFFECGKVEWPSLIRNLERKRGNSYRT